MKKAILTGLLSICLSAPLLGGVALAQQPGGNQPGGNQPGGNNYADQAAQTAHNMGNDIGNKASGSSWGWLGLIGLVGLAGLRGRHAHEHGQEHESTPRQTFRRDEPLGSR
jgi:MYXO-CTERM domain-containing protein